MSDQNEQEKLEDNTFEISARILGNELFALRLAANNFKDKWLLTGIVSTLLLTWIVSAYGDNFVSMFSSLGG